MLGIAAEGDTMRRALHILLIGLTVPLCCAGGYYATRDGRGYGVGYDHSIAAIDLKDLPAPTTAPARPEADSD
ncbi:MAG TPA: hypothetical protein VM031_03540 [Phycisphaerae bacterium]|nr:hypothetical protein [Phycisphaerae bacterium]